jgi:hypothetical protein
LAGEILLSQQGQQEIRSRRGAQTGVPGADGAHQGIRPKNRIGFVENVHKYERARNDHHPNVRGNAAIAENIYLYLTENHKDELLKHRLAR